MGEQKLSRFPMNHDQTDVSIFLHETNESTKKTQINILLTQNRKWKTAVADWISSI